MKEEILKPLNNKKENFFLIICVTLILLTALSLIKYNKIDHFEKKIEKNEISSFNSFNSVENSIYSELENFLFELSFYENIIDFPSVDKLEKEGHYPFIKDDLWERRAKILWFDKKSEDKNIYIGISQDINISGHFLIESIRKDDFIESQIYYSKKEIKDLKSIENIKEKYNFKKVVSLKGNDILEEK